MSSVSTTGKTKPRIRVVAAIIVKDGKVFSAKRAYGFLKGKWEFPGGKIQEGETPEQALIREIKEELDSEIAIDSFFMNEVYDYPDFVLDMDVFLCHLVEGKLQHEAGIHEDESFLDMKDLHSEEWCPADAEIVEALLRIHPKV